MTSYQTKVLIIGAGISGLKAAQELNCHGVDFQVLEGRERVGGRLHSVDFADGKLKVDLGASWFHDTLSNRLFDEVVDSGRHELYYDDETPILVTRDGVLDGQKLKIQQVTEEIIKFIELEYFENLDAKDVSLKRKIADYLFKQRNLLTESQIDYSPQLLRYLELWHGVGWQSMSSKYAMVDNVGRNCLIKDGYSSIVQDIMGTIPAEKIALSTVVSKIDRSDSKIVTVTTTSGDTYSCEYCIVTVPQSILQLDPAEQAGIAWTPKLPARITEALGKMHFGSLGKFIFEFERLFWDADSSDRFVALGAPDPGVVEKLRKGERLEVADFVPESDVVPKTWDYPILILNLYKSYQVPALLVFTQGELTKRLENEPGVAWEHMKPIFEKLAVGEDGIPEPKNVIATSWSKDPFSRGSYAACYPGDDPTDLVIQLSRGVGSVRFAGEHTILDGAGAVHGAWMSGQREARHVLIKMGLLEGDLDEYE